MFLVRGPIAAFDQLRSEVGGLLRTFDRDLWPGPRAFPAVNIWEDADAFHAEAELPGLSMDEIEVYVEGSELTIKGRGSNGKPDDKLYHRRERGTGEFSRAFTLPVSINAEQVSATLKDGVLTIVLPKHPEAKTKRIAVKQE